MHAAANGWYFYSGAAAAYERRQIERGQDYGYSQLLETSNHDRAARALHIEPNELPTDLVTREQFEAFVDSLTDHYAHQATIARTVLTSVSNGERVEA